jgi:hypothetical protein
MRELSNLRNLDERHDVVGTGDGVHGEDRGKPAERAGDALEAAGKSLDEHIGSKAPGSGGWIALGFGFSFHSVSLMMPVDA